MTRKTVLALILAASMATATACGRGDSPDTPTATTTAPSQSPTRSASPTSEKPTVTPEELPTVDNTRVDRTDPSDVADKFAVFSTTFAPGDVVDEKNQVERGYPLTTDKYRREHKPLEPNGAIVRIRSWYNQSTSDNDPVAVVESTSEWVQRPSPVGENADRARRVLRTVQTPITESGRKLHSRTLEWTIQLQKQKDGTWLVDDTSSLEIEKKK